MADEYQPPVDHLTDRHMPKAPVTHAPGMVSWIGQGADYYRTSEFGRARLFGIPSDHVVVHLLCQGVADGLDQHPLIYEGRSAESISADFGVGRLWEIAGEEVEVIFGAGVPVGFRRKVSPQDLS